MKANAVLMALHPFVAAVDMRDGLIFLFQFLRGLSKGLARAQLTKTVLRAQLKIPILGHVFGAGEALLLGGLTPLFTFEIGRAMPGTAFTPAVDSDFIAENTVYFHVENPFCLKGLD